MIYQETAKPLPHQKLMDLIKKAQDGDREAFETVVESNLMLVYHTIHKYFPGTKHLDDFFQAGCIGLIKAIRYFDFSYGVRFATYAVPMILGEIQRFWREFLATGPLRVGRRIKEGVLLKAQDPDHYVDVLKQKGLTDEEIALVDAWQYPDYMSRVVYESHKDGDQFTMQDMLEDPNSLSFESMVEIKDAMRRHLTERECEVVLLLLSGLKQKEVGDRVGMSQAHVSRVFREARKKLMEAIA